jgi:uroporphyrinogen III methyltransferase/synthase
MKKTGKVYFVGAGPGEPGLITVKGKERLSEAEVIIYDRLLDPRLRMYFPEGAEAIYAGKKSGSHTFRQEEINKLIVEKASEGKIVVRLKGGDPFVFGRGGEEVEAVAATGIPFEVVPGVTAAVAVPAYAGIPVTHRNMGSSIAIVTGHEDPTKGPPVIKWEKLSTAADTLIFLMGVENLPQIAETLIKNGLSPDTEAAVIAQGASPQQLTITATIATIAAKAREKAVEPPAVLVVGRVVRLREKLCWFEKRPLFGKRILVTRPRHQAGRLSNLLLEEGANPVELPVISIEPIEDNPRLDKALAWMGEYSWIIFTSANAVDIFFQRLSENGVDSRALKGVKIAAIGSATAGELVKFGIRADFVPAQYTTESIARDLPARQGERILLPRAEGVAEDLEEELRRRGAVVDRVPLYRTTCAQQDASSLKEMLKGSKLDVVTLTSSSTARGLIALLGKDKSLLEKVVIACIGPVTAAMVGELGLRADVVAKEHTIAGLVQAIKEYYQKEQ